MIVVMGLLSALLDVLAPAHHPRSGLLASIDSQVAMAESAPLADVQPQPTEGVTSTLEEVAINLQGDTAYETNELDSTSGLQVNKAGRALYFRRNGTPPIAELSVDLGGGVLRHFRPGDVIRAPFSSFRVTRPSRTPYEYVRRLPTGFGSFAYLMISDDQQATFSEPAEVTFPPMPVYGLPAVDSYITVPKDTAGVGSVLGFLVNGWKRVRFYVTPDTLVLTSCSVFPWLGVAQSAGGGAAWYRQSQGKTYLDQGEGTFDLDTRGMAGRLWLEFKDVLPAGILNLRVRAEGIE